MEFILDFILHIDQYMINIVQEYHAWTYIILFIIIFVKRDWLLLLFFQEIHYSLWRELLPRYPGRLLR